jgi:hypothetical protein
MNKAICTGFLMATSLLTAVLLTATIQTYADQIEINNEQKNDVSGYKPNSQNCTQLNFDAHTSAGDEGVDCQNERAENTNQNASD